MADDQMRSPPGLPGGVWIIPALVVLGNLGYALWLNQLPLGLDKLGPVLIFMILVVPLSVLFLVTYAATLQRLRRSARPRSTIEMIALSSLLGLAACAVSFGLMVGVLGLEAALG